MALKTNSLEYWRRREEEKKETGKERRRKKKKRVVQAYLVESTCNLLQDKRDTKKQIRDRKTVHMNTMNI